MLNSEAHKVVKERNRNTNDRFERNYFKGLQESQLDAFNSNFADYKTKSNIGQLGLGYRERGNNALREGNNRERYNYK